MSSQTPHHYPSPTNHRQAQRWQLRRWAWAVAYPSWIGSCRKHSALRLLGMLRIGQLPPRCFYGCYLWSWPAMRLVPATMTSSLPRRPCSSQHRCCCGTEEGSSCCSACCPSGLVGAGWDFATSLKVNTETALALENSLQYFAMRFGDRSSHSAPRSLRHCLLLRISL